MEVSMTGNVQVKSQGCPGAGGEGGTGPVACEAHRPEMVTDKEETSTRHLMEQVVHPDNLNRAYKRVVANKGSAGVDGMQVHELLDWCREHKGNLIESLLEGTYQPVPVKGVQIPKPGGGKRQLGIPTAVDRLVQQAILQVLGPVLERKFSESSYGFRPGRSAHDALAQASQYVEDGYVYVVDIDLEKFFDRVNHDKLMARLARHVEDKRLLKLVRAFLNAGLMQNGVVQPRQEGTPQGGPLSPLLANLMLDDLDKELERRDHLFVRYADDCNIYVGSRRAGERVLESITGFLERNLKLRVNKEKSAVGRVDERTFLGYRLIPGWKPWDEREEHQDLQAASAGVDSAEQAGQADRKNQKPEPIPDRLGKLLPFDPQ